MLGRKTQHSERKAHFSWGTTSEPTQNPLRRAPLTSGSPERQQWERMEIIAPGPPTAISGMCSKSQTPPPFRLLSSLFRFRGCKIFPKALRSQSPIQPRPSHPEESSAHRPAGKVVPESRGSLKKACLIPPPLCFVCSVCKDYPLPRQNLTERGRVLYLAHGRLSLSPGNYLLNQCPCLPECAVWPHWAPEPD